MARSMSLDLAESRSLARRGITPLHLEETPDTSLLQ